MTDRRLAPLTAAAGLACCVGTALAAVAFGGVALASLGRFGLVSAALLVGVVGLAWMLDQRRASDDRRTEPTMSSSEIR